ncbi:hypothetical protein B0H67DRAFT_474439 [Lasiosphaeris hirsuta]|uniref:Sterol 3-beta-glucosyltransferase UGT80B1 n=1 Tax=Lasiosphaeris hirsuta TaxID=260670 RepID=A0AA40E8U4_9PEZI|nr:hypothetical protein B0H67DRAFT_474439 [Lasiosphaeris hirsuta]
MIANEDGRTNTVPIPEELDIPDLGGEQIPPPAYGDHLDQLLLSQAGFEAGAAVTDDGRINININQKNRRLADLLAPTLRSQLHTEPRPLPAGQAPLPPAYIPPSLGGQPGQTPPPQLNIVIQIVGSRGDVQPFVALGQVLRDTYGHRVRVATHPTFQKFVEDNGLEFFSIGGDPAELMAFMVKNPGLMPGIDALKSGEITKRRKGIEEILMGCWRSCIEAGNGLGPPIRQQRPEVPIDESYTLPGDSRERPFVADAIIANPPSFGHIHIAEKLGIPMHMMFTMPWSPTRAFPHPLANIESTNTDVVMTNYISYALVEMMTWQGLGDVINRFRTKILDLEPLSLIWAPGLLSRLRIPTTYCWSPALIPKPADWAAEVTIAGFFFLNLASSYTPEPDLAAFLAAGPPPVYIGFGSIVVENPNALTRMIFDAVSQLGIRALVSKGWGGLGVDSVGIPDGVFMLGNCPHDWLFKHVSAVVHHGGAGTSAAGINLGKPTVVVPFFGDQPFWGAMIAKAGAGPAPIPFKKLTAENLAGAIADALKPETRARAEGLGASIREEKGADVGGKSFHEFLNTDIMRCSLAPSRVAVWRVRRTKMRLSALAATVLVKEGQLKYADLKLYRPMEYSTEDQPWDPISAVTSALVGDLGTMAMAVADFPRDMFNKETAKDGDAKPKSSPAGAPIAGSAKTEDTASMASTGLPSVSVSTSSTLSPGEHASEVSSTAPSHQSGLTSASQTSIQSIPTVGVPSPRQGRSPQTSRGADATGLLKNPTLREDASSSQNQLNLENAIGAGKGVGRIVETGMQMPINVCMGLARGFRNAPKLYNDDTVRPTEKVTGFTSGLKIAGKEFGLGFYDGVSGLVTQPLKGAEKDGGRGLLKGIGKGIGGLILKPAAAVWALPAYTMQGVQAEVRNMFSTSSDNYILTSRVVQGRDEMRKATAEEQRDIVERWHRRGGELKGFYMLKLRERSSGSVAEVEGDLPDTAVTAGTGRNTTNSSLMEDYPGGNTNGPPRTGWFHTRNVSLEERRKLHREKEIWQQKQRMAASRGVPPQGGDGAGSSSSSVPQLPHHTSADDEEFEKAIRISVAKTSRGDKTEDVKVEAAIRASLKEMRRIADEQSRELKGKGVDETKWPEGPGATLAGGWLPTMPGDEDLTNITDEEYQALIEEAVRQSISQQHEFGRRDDIDEDKELKRAIELSRVHPEGFDDAAELPAEMPPGFNVGNAGGGEVDDDELLRLALEESKRAHKAELERERTEEEIVLEYVKKQSLAEEAFRKTSRGKETAVGGAEAAEGDDEDLRRALEESLRLSGAGEGGPSSWGEK